VFNICRLLSQHFELDLLAVESGDRNHGSEADIFSKITVFSHSDLEYRINLLRGALSSSPIRPQYYHFSDVQGWIDANLHRYDGAICFYVNSTEYLRGKETPKIVDFIDCLSIDYREKSASFPAYDPRKIIYRREGTQLESYERGILDEFNHGFLTTQLEKNLIFGEENPKVTILPNGVDERFLTTEERSEKDWIVFLGRMDYFPNVDAARYFANEVFPEIRKEFPDMEFVIVGKEPNKKVKQLSENDSVKITGYVDEPERYLAQARVVVAPMRFATGIQNKILEAMAVGKPVVTTRGGAEGIEASPGTHIVVSDLDEDFPEDVMELLRSPVKRNQIGSAARERIRERYTWEAIRKPLYERVSRVVEQPADRNRG
jgi:sugar transferase (PEP-CTERM/EpsH1 system associated)